ncbi:hypothetical protein [Cytobacillus purgationiresistens]|uniref:Uncharacterized protein n=1 Tax=Cytobacillus purgationiresistens TaxID=863449 RepID=A0ABU0AD41_9BACI|nr:hypothetical protein [Cytobacillus purgationiresistens]MDQ0269176.1 hypothetical protein [Cytobacillus purgationiresistens]
MTRQTIDGKVDWSTWRGNQPLSRKATKYTKTANKKDQKVGKAT